MIDLYATDEDPRSKLWTWQTRWLWAPSWPSNIQNYQMDQCRTTDALIQALGLPEPRVDNKALVKIKGGVVSHPASGATVNAWEVIRKLYTMPRLSKERYLEDTARRNSYE